MLRVLVVEDMVIIRNGIVALLKKKYNFDVLVASNGLEAIDILNEFKVDFILTDIKMPKCDGIGLIKKIRDENLEIPIVIISGYGEFEYAEKAINMGVSGYLLKPIEDSAFEKTINKILKEIEDKKKQKNILEEYKGAKKVISELGTTLLIQDAIFREIDITEFDEVKHLKGLKFSVAILNINLQNNEEKAFDYNDLNLVKYSAKKIISEMDKESNFYLIDSPNCANQIIIFFYDKDEINLENNTYKFCQSISENLKKFIKLEVSIGISDVSSKIEKKLYQQAEDYLQMRFFRNDRNVFKYNKIKTSIITDGIIERIALIEKYIQRGDLINLRLIIESLFVVNVYDVNPKRYISTILNEIIEIIIKLYGYDVYNLINSKIGLSRYIYEVKDTEALVNFIVKFIEEIYEIKNIKKVNNENIPVQVKKYIEKNYSEDLSVKKLAELFNVNYSYLSAIFTKEIGESVVSYITKVRIMKAKKLLENTSADIGTIAESVGYSDLQYFYRVFKKNTQKTPMAYRNITKKVQ
ncbi:TPA: response regulator [Clostridium perfringens]|nr:response regulator [Clostridium perfringens]